MTATIEYLYAASRQVCIAGYHREQLISVLAGLTQFPEQSPIPVQACFEGVLSAAISAEDKLGEAIGIGDALGKLGRPPLQSALAKAPAGAPFDALRAWLNDPFWGYVRAVRRMAVHHFYDKAGNNGAYVLGSVDHAYEQTLNGYSPTLEDFTADIMSALKKLTEPIKELTTRYHLELEWDEKVQAATISAA